MYNYNWQDEQIGESKILPDFLKVLSKSMYPAGRALLDIDIEECTKKLKEFNARQRKKGFLPPLVPFAKYCVRERK